MADRDAQIADLLPYQDYLAMEPAESLLLGVDGNDEAAAASRLQIAISLAEQHLQMMNAAYSETQWLRKPEVDAPFGLYLTIRCQGDAAAALNDPDLRQHVTNHLGFADRDVFVHDETGYRWEIDNRGRDLPENQKLIDDTLGRLRQDVMGSVQTHDLDRTLERIEAARDLLVASNDAAVDPADGQVQADRASPVARL